MIDMGIVGMSWIEI